MTTTATPGATTATTVLLDAFGRVHDDLPALLDGLDEDALHWRVDGGSNPIGWLVWHLTRVQDDYHAATHALTIDVLQGLDAAAYDRVVDERWDPPVTAAVRLVSVVNDITQHLGQAAFVRGLLERR
jgi:hypothetical protein